MANSILLAYSGGLDTSAIIPWLKEQYGCEVIAYCADLGDSPDEGKLRDKALEHGASRLIFEDLRKPFVEDFVFPMLRAQAVYQDDYLLGTAIARPLIAQRMAHHAIEAGCTGVAHGATGKGNDQIRFEKALAYLAPGLEIIAPWKVWDFTGRGDLQRYLLGLGFEVPSEAKKYSIDTNLFHKSTEGAELEAIDGSYPQTEIMGRPTASGSEQLTIGFELGIPVRLNGQSREASCLLSKLNSVGSRFGIGIVDLVEERFNGIKSRGIYQTPGGHILHTALRQLKHCCWNRDLLRIARSLGESYGELVYDGEWHGTARRAIDGFFEEACECLCGDITLDISAHQLTVAGRSSPFSLYQRELVSFEEDRHQLNRASVGFCTTITTKSRLEGQQYYKTSRLS